jgi:hypothetical protein
MRTHSATSWNRTPTWQQPLEKVNGIESLVLQMAKQATVHSLAPAVVLYLRLQLQETTYCSVCSQKNPHNGCRCNAEVCLHVPSYLHTKCELRESRTSWGLPNPTAPAAALSHPICVDHVFEASECQLITRLASWLVLRSHPRLGTVEERATPNPCNNRTGP